MELDKIYNEDCLKTIKNLEYDSIDLVVTSPPYNTGGRGEYWSNNIVNGKRVYKKEKRYDVYNDKQTTSDYIDFLVDLVNRLDEPLKKNSVILMNLSYGNENPSDMWLFIADLIKNTPYMVADCIVWKKTSALPNSTSRNKLTRICEFVFVIARKCEIDTYNTAKKVISISPKKQNFYEVFYNIVEAKNNDEATGINKATYSSELVAKLINMYLKKGDAVVYDPFMGTGTTAIASINCGFNFIGSEISKKQCDHANKRISKNRLPIFDGVF